MRKLMSLLFVFTLFIFTPFVLSGCGKERVVSSDSVHDTVFADVDTTGVFSEFPVVYPGGISAEEINELGRLEHERRMAEGSVSAKTQNGWQLYVEVPFYSQRDPNWIQRTLGFSSLRIGDYGCHLSCISMLYARWGYYNMNPRNLNDWAKNSGAFSGADLIAERAIDYPGNRNVRYINSNQIYGELAAGRPVIVRTTFGGSHFLIIFAFDGQRYWVKDPWKDWTQQDQPLYGYAHPLHPFRVYGN